MTFFLLLNCFWFAECWVINQFYSGILIFLAAAAAKSLQSCPTLCDPTDGSPLGWDSPGKNTGVGCHFLLQCMKVKSESEVAQSCPTLPDPMDCSPPGSSIHGIFQARVLEWGAIVFFSKYTSNKTTPYVRLKARADMGNQLCVLSYTLKIYKNVKKVPLF